MLFPNICIELNTRQLTPLGGYKGSKPGNQIKFIIEL